MADAPAGAAAWPQRGAVVWPRFDRIDPSGALARSPMSNSPTLHRLLICDGFRGPADRIPSPTV